MMANNNGCGCSGRRNSNNGYGCLNSVGGRYRRRNHPYYGGRCPDEEGNYENDEEKREDECGCGRRGRRRRRRHDGRARFGMFTAMTPVAVAANGIIPLVGNGCGCDGLGVNSGRINIEESGTYLATYAVRVPEGAEMESTVTLDVNDVSQASAVVEVGGDGPACFTAQALFEVDDRAAVTLRSSEVINITDVCLQPLFTLTLVQLDEGRDE